MEKLSIISLLTVLIALSNNANSQDLLWAKQLGGTSEDLSFSMAVDDSGNVYTTGYFNGTADFDPGVGTFDLTSAGEWDIYVSKLDASGNFLWAKRMGGIGRDEGCSIAVDAFGNVYTTGYFVDTVDFDPNGGTYYLTTDGSTNIFVSKLNGSGNFVWAKQMGVGSSDDIGYSIAVDDSGNVYTTGVFYWTADFDPGPNIFELTSAGIFGDPNIFVSKLDASGNFIWAKQMGGIGWSNGASIAVDDNGNVYTMGYFSNAGDADFDPGAGTYNLTSASNYDNFISKLDASGNFVWAKQIGGSDYLGVGCSLTIDADGNVYSTGGFLATCDFDPGVGTYDLTSTYVGSTDIFVSKLDASGNFIWAKQMGGMSADAGESIALDSYENVYTTGVFSDTCDFDPGTGIYDLVPYDEPDVFISKLDADGNFLSAERLGGNNEAEGFSIYVSDNENIYVAGYFAGTADFDPGAGSYNLTASDRDIFVVKLSDIPTGNAEILNGESMNDALVSPNPSSGSFIISSGNLIKEGAFEVFNLVGEKIFEETISNESKKEITLQNILRGIYFLKIKDGEKEYTQKLIVQ